MPDGSHFENEEVGIDPKVDRTWATFMGQFREQFPFEEDEDVEHESPIEVTVENNGGINEIDAPPNGEGIVQLEEGTTTIEASIAIAGQSTHEALARAIAKSQYKPQIIAALGGEGSEILLATIFKGFNIDPAAIDRTMLIAEIKNIPPEKKTPKKRKRNRNR